MVQEQGEQISRIDDNVEAVTENVEGVSSHYSLKTLSQVSALTNPLSDQAQRELLRYWNRVSGNRMLIAKMFGVLMICRFRCNPRRPTAHDANSFLVFLLWVLIAG